MEILYVAQLQKMYKLTGGYYCIDDTMKHHTNFCKWIHGVFVLFDHAAKTNLKATCIVFLYYSDGGFIKFSITYRIYHKDTDCMSWQRGKPKECKAKYDLALEIVDWNFLLLTSDSAILTETRFHTSFILKKAYDFMIFDRIILTSVSSWTRYACPPWVFKGMGRKA